MNYLKQNTKTLFIALAILILGVAGYFFSLKFFASSLSLEDVVTVVDEAQIEASMPIPKPKDKAIIKITGKVNNLNSEGAILMDLASLEQLREVTYSIKEDPFDKKSVTYQGVLWQDLLELWDVDKDAETLLITALNDYSISMSIEDFWSYPIVMALRLDGVYIQPDKYGPAMMVLPIDHYKFDPSYIRHNWIWQIKSIEVL